MRSAEVAGVDTAIDHWIGGRRVGSPRTFSDLSPIDESHLASVARGGAEEASAAVSAAGDAFSSWGRTSREERAEVLYRIAEGIEGRIDELAAVETRDNGSLLRSNLRGLMPRSAYNFRFFADFLLELGYLKFDTRGHRNRVSHQPSGVTVLITPWNAPLMLATWKVAPALAAGNTVVLKPAEWSPLTASLLADITEEAGLPPGVLNVVQGYGEEAGAALVSDPRVSRISFTGSVETARLIGAAAGANLVPLSLELGGKSPLVVLEDADLEMAVEMAVEQYDNAGQVCLAATRLLVHQSLFDDFLDRFLAKAGDLVQGDPRSADTDLGPLISRAHLERVDGFVRRAVADGAHPVLGGGPNRELGGLYYRPTLFLGAPQGSEILTEEVFGPVLTLQSFTSDTEVVEQANSTRYGLAAGLVTGDPERAQRLSDQIVSGTTWVNCFYVRDLRAPFGGSRHSGIGREGGAYSFDFYCDLNNTVLGPGGWREETDYG
ncbi:MAG: aldehyde dehydrogenase [bacterium]|nr:aldehyde dehydrogenase [Acidimicrobiia bacterium]MCY4649320.1 aldehyde dehydrogenase [bacterium]